MVAVLFYIYIYTILWYYFTNYSVFQIQPTQLLSHLYLIDSICKNHGLPFKDLFQQNLVSNFALVFSKVDEKVRFYIDTDIKLLICPHVLKKCR